MTRQVQSSRLATRGSRCVALIIDAILIFIPCYPCWKDYIREGRSIGSGLMGIRVVKVSNPNQGPGCGGACLRNCCSLAPCGWICTYLNGEHRHFGDLIGGTMVIKDK